jgi:hypothetical protein
MSDLTSLIPDRTPPELRANLAQKLKDQAGGLFGH